MDYLKWNKAIWNHFFNEDNKGQIVVLNASSRVLKRIGEAKDIDDPTNDFFKAVENGPYDENPYRFEGLNNNKNIIEKAYTLKEWAYGEKPKTYLVGSTNYVKLNVWRKEDEPPYLCYLFFIIMHVEDNDSTFWNTLKEKTPSKKKVGSQNGKQLLAIFIHLEEFAKGRGFIFYASNIYGNEKGRKYVGHIFSQYPLTTKDEDELKGSLFGLKSKNNEQYKVITDESNEDDHENFIKRNLSLLAPRTQRFWNDSGKGKQVILRCFLANLTAYIGEIDVEKERLNNILSERSKNNSGNVNLQFYRFFKAVNGKISIENCLLIGSNVNNLPSTGELEFQKKKNKTKLRIDLNGMLLSIGGVQYFKYRILDELQSGKYENPVKNLGFNIPSKDENIYFPLFYKKVSNNYYIINQSPELEYKAGDNSWQILSDTSINNEYVKYFKDINIEGFLNPIKRFKIDSDRIKEKDLNNVDICGTKVKMIDSADIFIKDIKGLSDGKKGRTSFHCSFPIRAIIVSSNILEDNFVVSAFEKITQERIEFKPVETNDELSEEKEYLMDNPHIGEYVLEIWRNGKKLSLPATQNQLFQVTNENKDIRVEQNEISSFDLDSAGISNLKYINSNDCGNNEKIILEEDIVQEIIDKIIKTGGVYNVYSEKLKLLVNENLPEQIKSVYAGEGIEKLVISLNKKLFRALEDVGVVVRKDNSFKWIKPYWADRIKERSYYIRGALTKKETEELSRISSIIALDRSFVKKEKINNKWITFVVQLPPLLICNKTDIKGLPTLKGRIEYNEPQIILPQLSEPSHSGFIEKKNLPLEYVSIDNEFGRVYFNPNSNKGLSYFDPSCFKFINFTNKEEFDAYMEFAGVRLIRVVNMNVYNRFDESHYFLFKRDAHEENWKYKYYNYMQYAEAKYAFLHSLRHNDYSMDLIKGNQTEEKLIEVLLNSTTIRDRKNELFYWRENPEVLKEYLNTMVVSDLHSKSITQQRVKFRYDINNQFFAVDSLMPLPQNYHMALIGLTGNISDKINLDDKQGSRFSVYYGVPESIAFKVSNELTGNRVHPGYDAKPYVPFLYSERIITE